MKKGIFKFRHRLIPLLSNKRWINSFFMCSLNAWVKDHLLLCKTIFVVLRDEKLKTIHWLRRVRAFQVFDYRNCSPRQFAVKKKKQKWTRIQMYQKNTTDYNYEDISKQFCWKESYIVPDARVIAKSETNHCMPGFQLVLLSRLLSLFLPKYVSN